MSASKSINAVQIETHTATLDELNPVHTEPLLQTIAKGEVPSNNQFNDAIDRAVDSIEETKRKAHLNDKGERLVHDAEDLLHTAQRLINERNSGDNIQHLLADSRELGHDVTSEASKQGGKLVKDIRSSLPHIPSKTELILRALPTVATSLPGVLHQIPDLSSLSMDNIKDFVASLTSTAEFNFPTEGLKELGGDAKDAYNLGKEIILYSVRSKEFRGLLNDLMEFFHSSFGDLSSAASEVGHAVKMDIDSKDVSASHTRDTLKKDGQHIVESAKDSHPIEMTAELRQEYYQKFTKLVNRIAEKPEYKQLLELVWKYVDEMKEKADKVADKLKDSATKAAEGLKEKGEQLKDKLSDKAEDLKDMAKDKAVQLKDQVKERAMELEEEVEESAERVRDESAPAFDKVWNDISDLIDSFGGRGTFDQFYSNLYHLYRHFFNDPQARKYLHDLRVYTSATVHNPKSLATQSTADQGMEIITRGRELIQSKRYKRRFNNFMSQWRSLLDNFTHDSLVNEFSDELHQFFRDFALDSKGRPDIYALTESLDQIKSFIYPILIKQLENMTVAKIVGNSESYDWTIENLSIGIANFVPESFDLRTKNHTKMNVKDFEAKESNTRVVLDIHSLKPHFNDVKFWYRRRSFPHIEDNGLVDVDLTGGVGTRIKIIWKIKSKHNRPFVFSLMEVKCVIDKLDINVKDAKHDILDKMAASLFVNSIKQQIANGIVNSIVDVLHPINDSMNKWFATRPIGHIYDKLNERIHETFVKGADQTNKFIQNHPMDKIAHKAQDAIEYAKDQASETYDMVVDRSSDVRDAAQILKRKAEKTLSEESGSDFKERAAHIKDAVVEKATNIKDQVQSMDISGYIPSDMDDAKEKAGQLKDKIVEKGTELKEAAEQRYPNATHRAYEMADAAMEKGTQIKDQIMEQAPELADKASKKASELKDAAIEKGTQIKDQVMEQAPELAKKASAMKDAAVEKGTQIKDQVMEQAPELADKAAKKASELKDAAVEKGTQIKDQVMEQAPELADKASKKASELKDAAMEKGAELSEKAKEVAQEKAPQLTKKASELKDAAMEKGAELTDKAKERAGQAKDAAMEKGAELAEKYPDAAKKASELKDKAMETASDLKDRAVEMKDAAVEKGAQLADSGKSKASGVSAYVPSSIPDAADKASKKASELKDAAMEKGAELKDAAMEKASDLTDAAKGASTPKEGKWHSEWKKPSKTAKPVRVEKVTITETKEVIMEEKIASNPFEALSEENLASLKKNAA